MPTQMENTLAKIKGAEILDMDEIVSGQEVQVFADGMMALIVAPHGPGKISVNMSLDIDFDEVGVEDDPDAQLIIDHIEGETANELVVRFGDMDFKIETGKN